MNLEMKVLGIDPNANFRHPQLGLNRCPDNEAQWDSVTWQNGNGGTKPTYAELVAASYPADYQAALDNEAARIAARPKRSEINAAKAATQAASSVAALRASMEGLIDLMDRVLLFQQVDVDEDV
jgi:hypothetical protein